MSFLSSTAATPAVSYRKFGYEKNPFPVRASVRREVYVDRPEVAQLKKEFETFVVHGGAGAMWPIEAASGVGKSNLLRHIDWELERREERDETPSLAHCYMTGQLVRPRSLQGSMVSALGEKRLCSWLESSPALPSYMRESNLGRLAAAVASGAAKASEGAQFLSRWLSGEETRAADRKAFGIQTRERLEPGAALPYLSAIVDGLVGASSIGGVVLLLDEQEDTMVQPRGQRSAYLMALKGLVNAFNFQHIFVILAGNPGVFALLGQENVSLASRWKNPIRLRPIETAEAAWRLAVAHMQFEAPATPIEQFQPRRETVEATFGRLAGGKGSVVQRDLLDELHRWVEGEIAKQPRPAGAPPARPSKPRAPAR
jgi:hypothetical protein